jgi:guanylate cyclase soluble subunit beta
MKIARLLNQLYTAFDVLTDPKKNPNVYKVSPFFLGSFNHLTPELNPSTQRCLTRFLLGILLLEPCISLIYA